MQKLGSRRDVASFPAVVATLLMLPAFGGAAPAGAAATEPGGTNCTRSCGSISIPYPFGIEPGCYHAAGFNLTCDSSYQPPKLFLGDGNVPVLEISIPNATVRINSSRVNFTEVVGTVNKTLGVGLPQGSPYFQSGWYDYRNMLHVESCDVRVDLLGGEPNKLIASCTAICPSLNDNSNLVGDGSCAGIRCCQANIDLGSSFYTIQIQNQKLNGSLFSMSPDDLGSVYIVDRDFNYTNKLSDNPPEAVPATLSWLIASDSSCPTNVSALECRSTHSSCPNMSDFLATDTGYRCQCSDGYQGNPYYAGGCQDIDECSFPETYPCYGDCKNTPGSFICLCPAGYKGNASVLDGCQDINECENKEEHSCFGNCQNLKGSFQCQCPNGTYGNPSIKDGCVMMTKKNSSTDLSIGLGVGGGTSLLLALGAPFIIRKLKLQKEKKKAPRNR